MPPAGDTTKRDGLKPALEVLEGSARGQLFALDKRTMVIGRMQGVEICVDDAGVSRRHVKLTVAADGKIVATDLRSTNGMVVNGEKIATKALDAGDTITLGPDACFRLAFLSDDDLARGVVPLSGSREAADNLAKRHRGGTKNIEDAAEAARRDHLPLSARQLEVSQLVADGLTNAEVAGRLGISPRTVTSHLDHIYGRLNIGSRAALTRWIVERGLVRTETTETD